MSSVFMSDAYKMHVSDKQWSRWITSHTPLGRHPHSRDQLWLHYLDRREGMYVPGLPGNGKSSFLKTQIFDDACKGQAVTVLDPHGDMVMECIAELPEECLPYTYLIDMEDEDFPFGLNIFAVNRSLKTIDQAAAVDRILHIFELLWPKVLEQQHLPRYVRSAIIVFLANPGATLPDMRKFLLNDQFRHSMLQHVSDADVKEFWQTEYDDLKPDVRKGRVQPLLNRLDALFLARPLVRNIVGQRHSSIDFRKAIEQQELIFIKLPSRTVPEDAALIGTLLVAAIQDAIFSFIDTPPDARPGVSLYVDEFQNFATPD